MERAIGFYWVRFKDDVRRGDLKPTVGYYEGPVMYPWQVVGSDNIFEEEQLEVVEPVKPCTGSV